MTIRCIIVDDEPLATDILEAYVSKIAFLELVQICANAFEALDCLKRNTIDLIFLDINMPDLSGIEFLNALPQKPAVIFTTAYADYAVEGFNLDAVDYLLKPISFDRFLKAANKAESFLASKQSGKEVVGADEAPTEHLFVKTEYKIVKVNLKDIWYVEGLKDYIKIVTFEGQLLTLQSMKNMQETLPDAQFMRVHKSYIIAMAYIESIERNKIKIQDKWIPIGTTYRDQFYKRIEH
ncbi:LytR/AlgR family response regulator transcription factor [Microscilla marina]|uniref:Two-component system response regulator n=1 Tax=Microscilla marina ATCC 23134 TaxID=313606 RepID=A1ZDS6_MICM2|nr:LytTR family DNA-binding domain-containing protein [Microscilla marina]EAY31234.1 two-component system response regulator [Microscilla marina ATCC 23134]